MAANSKPTTNRISNKNNCISKISNFTMGRVPGPSENTRENIFLDMTFSVCVLLGDTRERK